jgi:starch synthase (maltosyl-transferring)
MWKASAKTHEEALIILNKDPWNHQYFYAENSGHLHSGRRSADGCVAGISPGIYSPKPFSYDLRPGQAFVLVTSRDHLPH